MRITPEHPIAAWGGALTAWLAVLLLAGVVALTWFGYRAANEWQSNAAQLIERRQHQVAVSLTINVVSRHARGAGRRCSTDTSGAATSWTRRSNWPTCSPRSSGATAIPKCSSRRDFRRSPTFVARAVPSAVDGRLLAASRLAAARSRTPRSRSC